MITVIPYAVASIVYYRGRAYLIEKIQYDFGPAYSIVGHEELGTHQEGMAWINHGDLEFKAAPTLKSWNQLASINVG